MWIEALVLLLAVCYSLHLWSFSYWKRRGVFQASPHFIFGNMKDVLLMKKTLHGSLEDIYRKYKQHKLVGLYSFYSPMLLVTDPELIRQVTVKDFSSFAGAAIDVSMDLDPFFAINPFSAPDVEMTIIGGMESANYWEERYMYQACCWVQKVFQFLKSHKSNTAKYYYRLMKKDLTPKIWKERRGLHAALQTPAKLKTITDTLIKVGRNMISFINERKSGPVKARDISDFFAIDSVSSFSFGQEPTAFTDPENPYRQHARETLFTAESSSAINYYFICPILAKLLSYRSISKGAENFFVSMSTSMLKFKEKNPTNANNFFEHILKANKKRIQEKNSGFSDIELGAHTFTVYVDSFFTTSSAFSYLLLELSKRPDVQEKLRAEILAVGKEFEDFDYDKINSLELLHMAINESLRIHSPVPVSARTCIKDTELGGKKIGKGTKVILPYLCLHKDPQYFKEPDKFEPERFLSEESLVGVKGTLLNFGDGPRMCLGSKYALIVIKIGIIYLLLNFNICPSEEESSKTGDILFPFDTLDENVKLRFQPINKK